MQLTRRIHFRTERSARSSRQPPRRRASSRPASARAGATQGSPTVAQRRVGPPEDYATYSCACGFIFEAPVTTTVGCPHCGSQLAW
jgi:hypothetical protein